MSPSLSSVDNTKFSHSMFVSKPYKSGAFFIQDKPIFQDLKDTEYTSHDSCLSLLNTLHLLYFPSATNPFYEKTNFSTIAIDAINYWKCSK